MGKIALLFGFLIFLGTKLYSQTITNKDIVAMKQAKVADDLIIAKISSGNCNFDVSAQALIDLKIAKISDKIMKQMIVSSSPDIIYTNDDMISLDKGKISDPIIKEIIKTVPHNFDTSPDGLIKLNEAKLSKSIIKEMLASPVKKSEQTDQKVNEEKSEVANSNTKSIKEPKKKITPQPVNSKNCKPFETTDLETSEKYILYGNTFNSGGVLGALAGNSESTKEYISVFGGFRGDKTIVLFQLDRVVGGKVQNKTNLKDLYVKKGEKIIIVTPNENIPFYTLAESRSTYKKELTGINLGDQERISLQAVCLATKAQIEKLSDIEIKEVVFVTTNGSTSRVRPSKGELKKFEEKINCLIATEKYQNSPDSPVMELTSDEALVELKKAKEKYELGLITKEEYEKVRKEMIQYIK